MITKLPTKRQRQFLSDYFYYLVVKLTADHERPPSHIYNDITNHRLRAYVLTTKHRDHFHNRMLLPSLAAIK